MTGPPVRPSEVSIPAVVAEVRAVFDAYEAALVATDAETLVASFWASGSVVRYGVGECLYGIEQIAEWRRGAEPLPPGRQTGPTVIATFGSAVACVSTEFRTPGRPIVGRQSQTWVRFPEGWRIVAAHVSIMPAAPAEP
jgi:Protein of unknown function (DUF3225)